MAGLSVAVVVFGASVWPGAGAAGADPTTSARNQALALQDEVTAAAAHVRDLTVAYQQANTQASALMAQVTADQARIRQLQNQFAATTAALRAEAIVSYTGGSTATPSSISGANDPSVRAEYLQVAAGNAADTLDAYRTEEGQMATAEASLRSELKASQAAAASADQARQAALAKAADLQARLGQVESQLAQLSATQAQGMPVGDGLVSVVRNVVSPAPAAGSGGGAGGVWLQLRECESGNNYQANTGNGYYGAYQFSQSTWSNLGYPGRPDTEAPGMQDAAAQKLQAEAGWGQWPACSAALGLT